MGIDPSNPLGLQVEKPVSDVQVSSQLVGVNIEMDWCTDFAADEAEKLDEDD